MFLCTDVTLKMFVVVVHLQSIGSDGIHASVRRTSRPFLQKVTFTKHDGKGPSDVPTVTKA